ncbi:40841_t:CDS:1, partial [Gigaspora margarita]
KRFAAIGSHYDAMKDTFCNTSILKAKLPPNSISRGKFLAYDYEDSYMKKFKNLDVDS